MNSMSKVEALDEVIGRLVLKVEALSPEGTSSVAKDLTDFRRMYQKLFGHVQAVAAEAIEKIVQEGKNFDLHMSDRLKNIASSLEEKCVEAIEKIDKEGKKVDLQMSDRLKRISRSLDDKCEGVINTARTEIRTELHNARLAGKTMETEYERYMAAGTKLNDQIKELTTMEKDVDSLVSSKTEEICKMQAEMLASGTKLDDQIKEVTTTMEKNLHVLLASKMEEICKLHAEMIASSLEVKEYIAAGDLKFCRAFSGSAKDRYPSRERFETDQEELIGKVRAGRELKKSDLGSAHEIARLRAASAF